MKVIADRHRHVALLVKQGSKWVHILRATPHGLEADKLTEEELTADWSELVNQSVAGAVQSFGGIAKKKGGTQSALQLLLEAGQEIESNWAWYHPELLNA
jgi:hypothetical protein